MLVNAIIAEYNPFHNGHKYQLDTCKTQAGADYTIVVISGDFTQRGAPALLPKHERARMALLGGADLVLELPLYYACGSAEYFANGAVALLDKLGVVNYLCFGSECGDIQKIQEIAELLQDEPPAYRESLKQALKNGMTYPQARKEALCSFFAGAESSSSITQDSRCQKCPAGQIPLTELLSTPNNILGIEYCRALMMRKSSILPFTIQRLGAAYHESALSGSELNASALAIRTALTEGMGFSVHMPFTKANTGHMKPDNEIAPALALCRDMLPPSSYEILCENWQKRCPVFEDDLSHVLHFKLLSEAEKGFSDYVDVTEDLSDRIVKRLPQFLSFSQFCTLLKTREMTYTRISRCLLHILLDMKRKTLADYIRQDYVPYARILGMKQSAAPLLHAVKQNGSLPLVSKLADADKLLSAEAFAMLKDDIRAAHLYQSILTSRYGVTIENEYQQKFQML